mgnify:FL=1
MLEMSEGRRRCEKKEILSVKQTEIVGKSSLDAVVFTTPGEDCDVSGEKCCKSVLQEEAKPGGQRNTVEKIPEKQSKKSLFYEILRFLLVGGTATVFDYAVAYLFYHLILPPDRIGGTLSLVLSTAFGFGVGLAVNWVLSVCFVFRNVKDKKKSRSGKAFVMFTLIGLIGLGLTEIGMHFGVSCLPEISLFGSATFLGISWTWWISKVAMTCIVLVWNYLGRKLFIFR